MRDLLDPGDGYKAKSSSCFVHLNVPLGEFYDHPLEAGWLENAELYVLHPPGPAMLCMYVTDGVMSGHIDYCRKGERRGEEWGW